MNDRTIKRTTSKARTPQQECHGKECASGARNNYYLGKHLTPDSYRIEQHYSIERRRLVNRAVHGWGVVYGYSLSTDDPGGHAGELLIGAGLAFDEVGRELIQVHPVWMALDNLLVLDAKGRLVRRDGRLDDRFGNHERGDDKRGDDERGDDKRGDECWLLTAHYAEKTIGHLTISDPCRCDRDEWDRTCETVVYSLRPIACEECCRPWKCELHCCCPPDTGCCSEHKRELAEIDREIGDLIDSYSKKIEELERQDPKRAEEVRRALEERLSPLAARRHEIEAKARSPRGGCACLCEHTAHRKFGADCERMADVDDCTTADLGNGVPLACVTLARDDCGDWAIEAIADACGPRPLVKRNDLLFDLINGCDLTTIVETGWARWHRRDEPVPFSEFARALGWTKRSEYIEQSTRDFWVRFSRPVRADTLKPDAFVMAVMTDQTDDAWREYRRVPIVWIDTDQVPAEDGDPPGHVRSARLVVTADWLDDAINDVDRAHLFTTGPTTVEIEVRGDLIEDCLGQQVDANSRGLAAYPSGNGSPGGTYRSSFTVAQRVIPPKKPKHQNPPAPPPRRPSRPSTTR